MHMILTGTCLRIRLYSGYIWLSQTLIDSYWHSAVTSDSKWELDVSLRTWPSIKTGQPGCYILEKKNKAVKEKFSYDDGNWKNFDLKRSVRGDLFSLSISFLFFQFAVRKIKTWSSVATGFFFFAASCYRQTSMKAWIDYCRSPRIIQKKINIHFPKGNGSSIEFQQCWCWFDDCRVLSFS